MKNKMIKMAAAVAALVGISACVQATPIVGNIGFGGGYSQVGGTSGALNTATSFTIPFAGVTINGGQVGGVFAGATTANLVSFVGSIGVNGNAPSLVGQQLWSVLMGSTLYTFTVGTAAQTLGAGNTTLTIAGSGTLGDGSSADNTGGTYTLAFGVSGNSFTFASTAANNVPDGGATVMLLGAALSAMGLLRKKLIA